MGCRCLHHWTGCCWAPRPQRLCYWTPPQCWCCDWNNLLCPCPPRIHCLCCSCLHPCCLWVLWSSCLCYPSHPWIDYGWDIGLARKIWTFGCPPDAKANVVVDATKGVQFLSEIKDHVVGAFMQVTTGGVLCDEVMRGIKFCITDVKLHADTIHRGAGQIMPCAKRVFCACQLGSSPKLLEPMFLLDITVPQSAQSGVFSTLNQNRGEIEKIEDRIGTPLSQIQAYLPVLESFGFTELLRKNTGGQAFPQMKFSHWKKVSGNPLNEGSSAHKILMETRQRKGLKMSLPKFVDYYDKV